MKERDTYNEAMEGNGLPDSLRVTPFSIPDDFFSKQQERIRAKMNYYSAPEGDFEQLEEPAWIRQAGNTFREHAAELTYHVPEGYFEMLQDSIQAKISESKLRESITQDGFITPADYFNNQEAIFQVRKIEDNLKSKIPGDGYSTPENYFGTLTDSIQSEILTGRWKQTTKSEGFLVPDNYFQDLFLAVTDATTVRGSDKTEPKVITISKHKSWLSYASAAAVALVIGFGSYFALRDTSLSSGTAAVALTGTSKIDLHDVSDEEILEYLAQVSDGEELIHLTKYMEPEKTSQTHIDNTIKDEDIKEYLNYML